MEVFRASVPFKDSACGESLPPILILAGEVLVELALDQEPQIPFCVEEGPDILMFIHVCND